MDSVKKEFRTLLNSIYGRDCLIQNQRTEYVLRLRTLFATHLLFGLEPGLFGWSKSTLEKTVTKQVRNLFIVPVG